MFFNTLFKKYSFLKNLPLKRINLYFKDEESFKNTKNPLDETRKIYKKTVANKVLNKIKE